MLTFLLGLILGTCIGAVVVGICRASYEHEAQDDAEVERPAPARHIAPL